MKITKILVALSFLFAVSTANAGELAVTGSMETTYGTHGNATTGNPLGMDRELKFAGSTELDSGITVSVMQDTSDAFALGNSQIAFSNIMGMATIYVGSDSDPMDGIDDVTPTAYEEANGSGSGTYTSNDIGDLAGETGIGIKFDLPFLGNVNAKHYPKADGAKNSDNGVSANANAAVGSGTSVAIKNNLGDISPAFDGATLTLGYEELQNSTIANTEDQEGATAALNYATGPISVGFQKKYHMEGKNLATSTAASPEYDYRDTAIGIAYAVNDSLSVSLNRYESDRSSAIDDGSNLEQTSEAFNIAYTMGGMTIGFQEARTDNANYATGEDDTRTLGVSVAF